MFLRTASFPISTILTMSEYLQGVRMQTVTSNLDQTERKNAVNINLKVDSDQGRLGIYAWMITVILTWPQLTSEASFSRTSQKHQIFPK